MPSGGWDEEQIHDTLYKIKQLSEKNMDSLKSLWSHAADSMIPIPDEHLDTLKTADLIDADGSLNAHTRNVAQKYLGIDAISGNFSTNIPDII